MGWSDGNDPRPAPGNVAPWTGHQLVFGGAPFLVEGWRDGVLGVQPPAAMAEAYGELSPDGPAHWPVVVAKANLLRETEPAIDEDQLRAMRLPVLIVLGDDEVRFDHAVRAADSSACPIIIQLAVQREL